MVILPDRYNYDSLIETIGRLKQVDPTIKTSGNFHFDGDSEIDKKPLNRYQLRDRLQNLIPTYPVSIRETWEDAQDQMATDIEAIKPWSKADVIEAAKDLATTADPGGYGANGKRTILLFNNPYTFLPHYVILPYSLLNAAELH